MSDSTSIVVALPSGARGFTPARAAEVIREAGLVEVVQRHAAGPFGSTSLGVALLEALTEAVDIAAEAARRVQAHVLESLAGGDFSLPSLPPPQRELVGAVATVVLADLALARLATLADPPAVEGALERDGLAVLLGREGPVESLLQRVLTMGGRYLALKVTQTEVSTEPAHTRSRAVVSTMAAFLTLLRRATLGHAESGTLRSLVAALERRSLRVVGHDYRGLVIRDAGHREASSGLLPVRPADIVGNDDYLRAGLRLARDVAGYDLITGRNPKRINPVLFGLGRPGCGKTVTAHAIGNDFLDFCRERDVPARFIVVRRTDWASSYQNASALNLVRIFEEEVYGFDGVCGVYWPDIDTALASRSSSGLRMEEKQNLGAVFGIFDGTLLPRDGKWFLICDANTLHMDEAAQSRIAQNPFTVTGPTTPEHFVRLMRDLELREVVGSCDLDDAAWARIGARAVELELSGRGVAAICGNVQAHVQDFELPDEWFSADAPGRERLLGELGRRVDETFVREQIDRWASFHAEAEARDEQVRFDEQVDGLVQHLNAGRVAAERVLQSAEALDGSAQERS